MGHVLAELFMPVLGPQTTVATDYQVVSSESSHNQLLEPTVNPILVAVSPKSQCSALA